MTPGSLANSMEHTSRTAHNLLFLTLPPPLEILFLPNTKPGYTNSNSLSLRLRFSSVFSCDAICFSTNFLDLIHLLRHVLPYLHLSAVAVDEESDSELRILC